MERCCSVREVLSLLRRWFTSCFSGQLIRRLATDCQLRHAVSHAVSNSELTELTPAGSEPPVLVALLTRYACRWTYDGAVLYWSFCELSRPTNQSADLLQVQQRSIGHPLCTCRLACSHTLNKDRQHSLKPQNLCKIWYQQLRDGFVTAPSQLNLMPCRWQVGPEPSCDWAGCRTASLARSCPCPSACNGGCVRGSGYLVVGFMLLVGLPLHMLRMFFWGTLLIRFFMQSLQSPKQHRSKWFIMIDKDPKDFQRVCFK